MRVINTRPHPDAAALTEVLAGLGHEVIAAPLLEIRFEGRPRSLDLRGVQAVMATSANGVRALAVSTEARDVALFAVGDATGLRGLTWSPLHIDGVIRRPTMWADERLVVEKSTVTAAQVAQGEAFASHGENRVASR